MGFLDESFKKEFAKEIEKSDQARKEMSQDDLKSLIPKAMAFYKNYTPEQGKSAEFYNDGIRDIIIVSKPTEAKWEQYTQADGTISKRIYMRGKHGQIAVWIKFKGHQKTIDENNTVVLTGFIKTQYVLQGWDPPSGKKKDRYHPSVAVMCTKTGVKEEDIELGKDYYEVYQINPVQVLS